MNTDRKQEVHPPVYKVDIHAHLGPEANGKNLFSTGDRLAFDRFLGIGHAVILPYPVRGATDPSEEMVMATARARAAAQRVPEHFSWFCSVYPDGTHRTWERLKAYRDQGAVGVGELGFMLPFDDDRMDHLLTCCGELGLPVLFHLSPMGNGPYGVIDDPGLPRLERALAAHPGTTLIAHSQAFWYELGTYDKTLPAAQLNGFPFGRVTEEGRAVELLRKYPNLYADLSAYSGANAILRDPEYGIRFLDEFQDRLLYGTDQTDNGMVIPLGQMLDYYLIAGKLSSGAHRKICRRNAERLLGLKIKSTQS